MCTCIIIQLPYSSGIFVLMCDVDSFARCDEPSPNFRTLVQNIHCQFPNRFCFFVAVHPNALKYISLVTLTLQNAVLGLSMRYGRTRPGDMFLSSTGKLLRCDATLMSADACCSVPIPSAQLWSPPNWSNCSPVS